MNIATTMQAQLASDTEHDISDSTCHMNLSLDDIQDIVDYCRSNAGKFPSDSDDDDMKTCFYAEVGGQINHTGTIVLSKDGSLEASVSIMNVQLYGQFVLHVGTIECGSLSASGVVTCKVDYRRRQPIASNHTMTHVLNHALREVLIRHPDHNDEKLPPQLSPTLIRKDR